MSILGTNLPKNRFFRKTGIMPFFVSYCALTSYTKLENSDEQIIRYRTKGLFWVQFSPTLRKREFSRKIPAQLAIMKA